MATYIIKRILANIPVVIGLSILIFLMIHILPGNAVDVMLSEYGADAARLADLRQKLGLNDPLIVQYLRWAGGAVRGDFGTSIFSQRPVLAQIMEQLPSTAQLALAGTFISTILGVVLGVLAALRPNSFTDVLLRLMALLGISLPVFWLGLLGIFVFSLTLHWLPAAGSGDLKHLILPAVVVGFSSASTVARLTRTTMLEVMRADYVRTARAKGLSNQMVVIRHALRNCMVPIVTIIGIGFGYALGGTVVTETVFARQGVGLLAVNGILRHDVAVVQGTVLFLSLIFVVVNLLVDISYAWLDPRIRLSTSGE